MTEEKRDLEALLQEKRIFEPPADIVKNSNIKKFMDEHEIKDADELYQRAGDDPEWFWDSLAQELEWYKKWDKVLDWKSPYAKWFVGAKTNIVHNALDRHMKTGIKNKLAYIWEGEPGDVRKLSYFDLYREVNKLANGLKHLGVKKGDSVGIYLPMIPELPIAMMACAKIGAFHSVVFSGFSAKALRERLNDAHAKILITCDGSYRKGKAINIKANADEALKDARTVENVVVFNRLPEGELDVDMTGERDEWWHELTDGQSAECETEVMDAEDLLFLMYTSGTTGKPKGVKHTHGGYSVGTSQTLRFVFDLKDDDVWWCAADIGWITGHSYIVYGPLILGVTSIMYEGLPIYPKADRLWSMVEKYGVTVFYTAPTTIRMFMRFGEDWPQRHNLSSLRILGTVGEPINPEAWIWYHEYIGGKRCPVMDTWWQTETGSFIITPLPITPLKPGSATKPFPSFKAAIYNDRGESITGKGGHLVINTPWPAMLRGLYKEEERYKKTYWSRFKDAYLAGDVARKDEDGYFWIQGRADDVLNVAGHRIGTAEVESALVSHPAVAEAAAVGKPDKIKGEVIEAFVILREGYRGDVNLKGELIQHVSKEIGPIAKPAALNFVPDLPKTRSGKIMRRVVGALVKGQDPGDTSTLMNPEAVELVKKIVEGEN